MLLNKFIKLYLFIFSFIFSQSIYNAYGLGLSRTSFHSSVNGAGSVGLIPSFHPGVSMDNTATWPGLNFTYISGSYTNQAHAIKSSNINNQASRFNKFQFVIPIRERYALGLTVKPLNNNNSFFTTDTIAFNFEGADNLRLLLRTTDNSTGACQLQFGDSDNSIIPLSIIVSPSNASL